MTVMYVTCLCLLLVFNGEGESYEFIMLIEIHYYTVIGCIVGMIMM